MKHFSIVSISRKAEAIFVALWIMMHVIPFILWNWNQISLESALLVAILIFIAGITIIIYHRSRAKVAVK